MSNPAGHIFQPELNAIKAHKWQLLGIGLLALALRLIWILLLYPEPNLQNGDGQFYLDVGRHVGRGLGVSLYWPDYRATSVVGPIYPYFIAFIQKVAGDRNLVNSIRVGQALVGLLTCLITFFLGLRWRNAKVGLIAALLIAIDLRYVIEAGELYTESVFILTLFLSVWIFAVALATPTNRWLFISGAVVGLTALVRPVAQFLPLAFCACLILSRDKTWREKALHSIWLLIGAQLITLPWTIRNIIRMEWKVSGIQSFSAFAPHILLLLLLVFIYSPRLQGLLNKYKLHLSIAAVVVFGVAAYNIRSFQIPLLGEGLDMHLFMALTEWDWEALQEHGDPKYGRENILHMYRYTDENGNVLYNFRPAIMEALRTNLPNIIMRRVNETVDAFLQPHGTVTIGAVLGGIGFKQTFSELLSGQASLGHILSQPDFLPKLSMYLLHFGSLVCGSLLVFTERRKRPSWNVYLFVALYFVAIYGLLFIIPRYVFPPLLLLHIPTAVAIARIVSWSKRKKSVAVPATSLPHTEAST